MVDDSTAQVEVGFREVVDNSQERFAAELAGAMPDMTGRWHLLFAALGTDLGTERGGFGANKGDVVKQVGRVDAC